uniref:J domain-containing protein n=1 Tax=Trichuris muris TaxID=70415 RepID=A0A5S6QDN9_TRIMR
MNDQSAVIDADKDFYKTLNVEKTATEAEIKNAYRKLAIRYHPDRNDGSPEAAERFKEISIAYAVLSDPNRRRQYDLCGPSNALVDFEGLDIGQMSGLRRFLGALCLAKDIIDNKHDPSMVQVVSLEFGELSVGRVERQDAKFYRISFGEEEYNKGIIISCRSSSMSKFKLVLFDRDGNVRLIRESVKTKRFTSAEMFFLPFDLKRVTEFFSLKFLKDAESEDIPLQFHLLDGFEPDQCIKLQPGEHLFCVYGDNWFQDIKYKVRVVVADCDSPPVKVIRETEAKLTQYKQEMSQFKDQYMLAKKQFEEAVGKLDHYTVEVTGCLKDREKAYIDFVNASAEKYSDLALDSVSQRPRSNGGGGILKGIFNSFTGSIGGK